MQLAILKTILKFKMGSEFELKMGPISLHVHVCVFRAFRDADEKCIRKMTIAFIDTTGSPKV